ncbi:MAG: SRPBCC domain-containing protein [Ginsengibacter sp.]
MKTQNYNCSITANTSAHHAFESINHVNEWWVKNIGGESEKQNDAFTVHFSGEIFVTFKITESVPDKKVVWHVTDCYLPWLKDKTEWNNTDVVFEIEPENNSSKINLTHVGLVPEVECYEGCVKGWEQYFKGSLLQLLTTGRGQPS